jgi:hypothetical protein
MLPVEFDNALKDWQEVEFGNLKTNYERTRLAIYYQILSQSTKSVTYNEFCTESLPYPWDEGKEIIQTNYDADLELMNNLGAKEMKALSLEEMSKLTG